MKYQAYTNIYFVDILQTTVGSVLQIQLCKAASKVMLQWVLCCGRKFNSGCVAKWLCRIKPIQYRKNFYYTSLRFKDISEKYCDM